MNSRVSDRFPRCAFRERNAPYRANARRPLEGRDLPSDRDEEGMQGTAFIWNLAFCVSRQKTIADSGRRFAGTPCSAQSGCLSQMSSIVVLILGACIAIIWATQTASSPDQIPGSDGRRPLRGNDDG
jgi:hypothetical protein